MRIPGWYRLVHLDRQLLRKIFGFERWHVQKTRDRPYVKNIIEFINNRDWENSRMLEVGAGLGDIARNVRVPSKVICDIDPKVVDACKFLARFRNLGAKQSEFKVFNFPDDKPDGKFDLIVLVNWIHMVPSEVLLPELHRYFEQHLNPDGFMVLDSTENSDVEKRHDFTEVINREDAEVSVVDGFVFDRKIMYMRKIK